MSRRKPDRQYLVQKVIKLARLPECKRTLHYLTKLQLLHLVAYIESLQDAPAAGGEHGASN